MNILQRKILFGGIAILILLTLVSVIFLYQPKIQARGKIQAEANNLRKQIQEMKEMVKGIGALRKQITNLEQQTAELLSHVAPRDQLLTLLRELAKIGERYNIAFLEIHPPGLDTMLQIETNERPIRPVPFQIVMQGRYLDIGSYLENLNQFPYFIKVPELELTGKDEIRPAIEARILLNIYTSSLPFSHPNDTTSIKPISKSDLAKPKGNHTISQSNTRKTKNPLVTDSVYDYWNPIRMEIVCQSCGSFFGGIGVKL